MPWSRTGTVQRRRKQFAHGRYKGKESDFLEAKSGHNFLGEWGADLATNFFRKPPKFVKNALLNFTTQNLQIHALRYN